MTPRALRKPGVAALLAAARIACTPRYLLPEPATCVQPGRAPAALEAAALRIDITPPSGLSLSGHGAEGRIGTGTLTRLVCTGFVMRWPGDGLVWVTCDLNSVSLMLQRRAAEVLHARTGLGADRLILTATHTHAGPAGFLGATAYLNSLGATRDPFYDQRVTDFIARRVADEAAAAWERRMRPAAVRYAEREVRGVNRNRAMPARARDPEYVARDCRDAADPRDARCELDPAHLNANRRLALLRVDALDGAAEPLGLLGVFGVHGTAIPNTNERYHGDLFAYARRFCESELAARHGGAPVCAIAPGTQGDASPDWGTQGVDEAERLGARLGWHLARAFDDAERDAPTRSVEVRYHEARLPGAAVAFGRLRRVPEIGTPAAGGAPDGVVRFRFVEQMQPGMTNTARNDEHGRRIAVLGFYPGTSDDARDGYMFSPIVPLWWLRFGDHAFATLPAEPTWAAGQRVELAIARANPATRTHVVVAMTGAYLDYLVTPEEYEAQLYEGASCPYGASTLEFLTERAANLASAPHPPRAGCRGRATVDTARWEYTPPGPDADTCGSTHPDLDGDPPTQPVAGSVNHACMRPSTEYVRPRWPDGLSYEAACPTGRASAGAVRVDPGLAETRRENIIAGPTLTLSWQDRRDLPLCGAPRVQLVDRDLVPISACRRALPPAGPAAEPLYPDPWSELPWLPCAGPARDRPALPVDDAHDFIEVWFDDEASAGAPVGTWRARFRIPHAGAGVAEAWERALRGAQLAVYDGDRGFRTHARVQP